ncbi:NAD(P)-dependent oxidoreductase (plasmid) [Aliirhizobium terrae]|uniref:NAD(P)-dependent oxidoreductase n=1 Tax=Terrirhizobium terrae TaxID=2926709 RepID=UPI002575E343|nr:NAD(P)-dependent oxidoreductase [Rhizobium sp. CC-CFT758]WJH37755.1 NAD(P)-dependent oxidoreductase [Rhizobium sp. CC-CFT758]
MKIAFIGLGSMGTPMARNLISAGFDLSGYDMSARALDTFERNGGKPASTAAKAAVGAEVAVLMVVNAAQAEQVLFADGVVDALLPGAVVVLMSTCPPGAVKDIAARVEKTGRSFVDAPVSGGVAGAESATLTIMVATSTENFERVSSMLRALGDKLFHVGTEAGQGAAVKVVNQLLCGVHIAAAAEGFALASQAGIDPQVILEILGGSSASSWMLRDRGPRMLQDDPAVTSSVDIFVKDLGLVLEAGREAKAALPLAASAYQMFLTTSGRGDGAADDSQVIRSYHLLNRG